MKTILLFTLAILTIVISGCQNKKNVKTTNKQQETVQVQPKTTLVKDTVQVIETKTTSTTPTVKETPEYFLIGGCFRIKDNADRMYENLHKEGYANAMIIPYYRDHYLVVYGGYKTEKEAIAAVRKIHKIPGKEETWIYHTK